ncbi:hypothetical protein HK102_012203, partial [Quaeritorhiza haematococci]
VGRRLRLARRRRRAAAGGAEFRDHDRRDPGVGRLAGRARGRVGGHGEHRRLLEADLQPPGAPVRGDGGQRPAHQAGAGAEDRRQGRRVDRPAAPARAALAELHPAAADPRAPRPHPPAHAIGPATRHGGQPGPEGAGGRRHQAGERRQRRPGGLGPGDDPGVDRRRGRPDRARGPGEAEAAGEDPRLAGGPARARDRPPPLHAAVADGPGPPPRPADRAVRRADREADQAVPGSRDAAADHPRGRRGVGRGDRGGDRRGHGPIPDPRPSGLMGRDVPGQRRERRQASHRPHDQGEPMAPHDDRAGGVGGHPRQGDR